MSIFHSSIVVSITEYFFIVKEMVHNKDCIKSFARPKILAVKPTTDITKHLFSSFFDYEYV